MVRRNKERIDLIKDIVFVHKKYMKCVLSYDLFLNSKVQRGYDNFKDTINKQKEFISLISFEDDDDFDSLFDREEFSLSNLKRIHDDFLEDLDYLADCITRKIKWFS